MSPRSSHWLIHIGMPKCASSSLQHILMSAENIFYDVSTDFSFNNVSHELIAETSKEKVNSFYESLLADKHLKRFDPLYKYMTSASNSPSRLKVISSETFIGYSDSDVKNLKNEFILQGLEPSILFITRDFQDYIISSWKQSILFGCLMPLSQYAKIKNPDFLSIERTWRKNFKQIISLKIEKNINIMHETISLLNKKYNLSIPLGENLTPQNEAKYTALTCSNYIDYILNGENCNLYKYIDSSWPPHSAELPPFNIQAHKERKLILTMLETELRRQMNNSELRKKEEEYQQTIFSELSFNDNTKNHEG